MAKGHHEEHFSASEQVRDIVIGMSDGLTVPFALAAGLSGAVGSTRIILTAGFAEIAAGSIAMGLGGYLAARTEAQHYARERDREYWEIVHKPEAETREVAEIFHSYGLDEAQAQPLVDAIKSDKDQWVDFMMRYELGLDEPEPRRAVNSALTIALSYIVGGLIPLLPYVFISQPARGLAVSSVVTLVALTGFGYLKGKWMGTGAGTGALQTAVVGGLAAAVAFLAARLLSGV
ncbi:MAG: VIT1/CCC1 transporter family protein [Symbiobacteriia bacterium]